MEQNPGNQPKPEADDNSRRERFLVSTARFVGRYCVGASTVAAGFATYFNLSGEHAAAQDISAKGIIALGLGAYILNRASAQDN